MLDVSLWGDDFTPKPEPEKVKKIVKKVSQPKEVKTVVDKQIKSTKVSLEDKLRLIEEEVYRVLGHIADDTLVIKDVETLANYIDVATNNGIISIDTETNNSLDPLTCKLMGPCIYTPGMKRAYIPIHHVDYRSGLKLADQLTEENIKEQFLRLTHTKIIMHNGKFDYKVIKCTTDVELDIYWDTLVAAKLLDENEVSAGLKQQYIKKIDPTQEKYSIDHLFNGVEYAFVKPEVFALYAAQDAYMTYKLYMWQKEQLEKEDLKKVYNLFKNVEMPLVKVVAEMELYGVAIDRDYAGLLSKKYHALLDDCDARIAVEMSTYESKINAWKLSKEGQEMVGKKTKAEQLTDPINLGSPTQLAILFYDILKVGVIDKKSPRGTGEEIMEKINLPITKLILERRGLIKLINTYIDVIPTLTNPKTDRIHTHFNQFGAATGRFSSSDPINLQNIPSHNREIRMIFRASDGCTLIGGDFSGQEPRLTAHYSNDESMIKAFMEKKDLYAQIASNMYNNRYEDNLEFYPEGTEIVLDGKKVICGNKTHQNKDGKGRRSQAKTVLLGILYGRGAASIAEQLGKTREEAQEIIDIFYKRYPKVKQWIDSTMSNAKKTGYVEDFIGRRRHLPDIQLPKYEIKSTTAAAAEFNPILGCKDRMDNSVNNLINKYKQQLDKVQYNRDYQNIKQKALTEGIEIHDNSGFISQAERQAVNSRVQGGAASLTKMAMLEIHNDQRLRDLGFRLMITVHDEVLGECPDENVEEVADRLAEVMIESAKPYTKVPMAVDAYCVKQWYFDEMTASIQAEFKKYISNMSHEDAMNTLYKNHIELSAETINKMLQE